LGLGSAAASELFGCGRAGKLGVRTSYDHNPTRDMFPIPSLYFPSLLCVGSRLPLASTLLLSHLYCTEASPHARMMTTRVFLLLAFLAGALAQQCQPSACFGVVCCSDDAFAAAASTLLGLYACCWSHHVICNCWDPQITRTHPEAAACLCCFRCCPCLCPLLQAKASSSWQAWMRTASSCSPSRSAQPRCR
jgi:hypothetical protein